MPCRSSMRFWTEPPWAHSRAEPIPVDGRDFGVPFGVWMLRLPVLTSPFDAKQFPFRAAYWRDNVNVMTSACMRISESLVGEGKRSEGKGREWSDLISLRRPHLQTICMQLAGASLPWFWLTQRERELPKRHLAINKWKVHLSNCPVYSDQTSFTPPLPAIPPSTAVYNPHPHVPYICLFISLLISSFYSSIHYL